MLRFNFLQTGGYKLTTETLSNLQAAYTIIGRLAVMAGSKAIVQGAVENGSNVTAGLLAIDGELYDLEAGIKQDYIAIKEYTQPRTFEDGTSKIVETYQFVAFTSSVTPYKWSDFKRVTALNSVAGLISDAFTTVNTKIDNFINTLGFLKKGSIFLGDIRGHSSGWYYNGGDYTVELTNTNDGTTNGGDDYYKVTFNTPLSTADYAVFTQISYSGSYISNNDIIATISNRTTTGFNISVREISLEVQNITLDYIILKK